MVISSKSPSWNRAARGPGARTSGAAAWVLALAFAVSFCMATCDEGCGADLPPPSIHPASLPLPALDWAGAALAGARFGGVRRAALVFGLLPDAVECSEPAETAPVAELRALLPRELLCTSSVAHSADDDTGSLHSRCVLLSAPPRPAAASEAGASGPAACGHVLTCVSMC